MTDTVDLHYELEGTGAPLLCAGGWGIRSAADFAALFPRIAAGRQIVTFHYRGVGESPYGPAEAEPSTRLYARDVLRVLDRAGIERVDLCGMGGMGPCVLMELACLAPERVGAAVLHEPWAVADTSLRWQLELLGEARRQSFESYQKLATVLCFTPGYIEEHAERIIETMWVPLRDREDTHLRFIRACIEHDARERLPKLRAPCLLITGDAADIMTGDRLLPPLQELLPHAETHVMRDTPHAFFESPANVVEFDEVVARFLQRYPLPIPAAADR